MTDAERIAELEAENGRLRDLHAWYASAFPKILNRCNAWLGSDFIRVGNDVAKLRDQVAAIIEELGIK